MKTQKKDSILYEPPFCEVLCVAPQRVICDSQIEHVGEDEGEW